MIMGLFSSRPDHLLGDAKELKRVLAELPTDNAFKTVDEIYGWFESLRLADDFRVDHFFAVVRQLDEAAQAVRQQFRDNRLPIAIAAVAGLAWIFREPIKDHAPKLAQKVQELADAARAKFQPGAAEDDLTEDQDEAAE